MSDRVDVKKTRGAWMITVREPEEKNDVPEQSNNHQFQPLDEKLKGGAR